MIDFRSIGTQQGFGDAIRMQARSADEAMERANEIIAAKNDTISQLRAELAQAQAALAVETAKSAALMAQAKALKGEVVKGLPQSYLLAKTGRVYLNGTAQTKLNDVWEKAYDAEFIRQGLPVSFNNRAVAK